ncbi:MAG: T9SS type A sorting domain-containing protein [candidate division WOR-3 bacterium]
MNTDQKFTLIIFATIVPIITFAQIERWVYRYDSDKGSASCLLYGADGNLYAGGYTVNPNTAYDFTIISLSNSGLERWVYKYLTIARNQDECRSICYGNDGNIYTTGNCTTSDSVLHLTIISLTPDGAERWVYQYSESSEANGICYDGDGNIYAVGSTQDKKILVVSVAANGAERWSYIYPTPSAESEPGRSVICGPDGNIYVVGYSGPPYNTDVTVICLTPSGSERWVYLYNGPDNYYDFGCDIIYAPDGNLYIFGSTCYFVPPGYTYWNGLAISLTSSGVERWTYVSQTDPSWFNKGVYGADGNLYMAGLAGWDILHFLVESISDASNYRWTYIENFNSLWWSWATALAYGDDGKIYVGGRTSTSDSGYFVVRKFAADSTLLWTYLNNPPSEDCGVSANAVVYGSDGNIYAAGTTYDSLTGDVFTVISLNSTGIEEEKGLKVETERLDLLVLPNVVKDNARIQYTISEKQAIRLELYDILGRKIKTIAEGTMEPGIYSYQLNSSEISSGVYFLILEGKRESKITKLLTMR